LYVFRSVFFFLLRIKYYYTTLLINHFYTFPANAQETEPSSNSLTLSGALIGTALVAIVAVLANIIQFVINAGLLMELRRSRSV